ncbi:MAG: hypothetical protein AAF721_26125 [Myxococcota bacterium]
MRRIERIERERLRDQVEVVEQWLRRDEEALAAAPEDEALRFFVTQGRRDRQRLLAASGGHTPSAVVHRPDAPARDDAAERLSLARDEARHTAENVVTFAERAAAPDADPSADVRRALRWAWRLALELRDVPADHGDVQRLVADVLRAPESERRAALAELHRVASQVVARWA